jgi:hypothetical protein
MKINDKKSLFFSWGLPEKSQHQATHILDIPHLTLNSSFKYLGFHLKANGYVKRDWMWLVEKIEKKNQFLVQWMALQGRQIGVIEIRS